MKSRIFLIKLLHSIIFFFYIGCLGYIAYAAFTRRFDIWLALAIGAISVEGVVLWANGWHCPLTRLAQKYGDPNGSVTDIFLPPVLDRNAFRISLTLSVVEATFLAVRYFTKG
jgi:hypothetical protein